MNHPNAIDHSFEATDKRLPEDLGRQRAWRGSEITPSDCVVTFDEAAIAEIHQLVQHMAEHPLPELMRRAEHFELPNIRKHIDRARDLLANAQGVAVLDALPMDDMDPEVAQTVFFTIGQLIGRPAAQKWDGKMLYDVRDSGATYGNGVRASVTNVELVFHTDNAFALAPPDVVGLMCHYPAREGGISRFCSLYAIHEALREQYPQQLERLYQPMFWDRQAEHAQDAPKTMFAPMFRIEGDRLLTRANVSLIRQGYELMGEEMDSALVDALQAVEAVSKEESLWFEQAIERGHLQYLNNIDTAHYRSDFVNHDDPRIHRHLVRTWHRDSGMPSYDG
jgi:alpha-ketoglutarate-dependent taurine dioxygenase